ncbi:hypothetical protein GCM10022282_02480 [Agromyces indicus]
MPCENAAMNKAIAAAAEPRTVRAARLDPTVATRTMTHPSLRDQNTAPPPRAHPCVLDTGRRKSAV